MFEKENYKHHPEFQIITEMCKQKKDLNIT